MNVYIAAEIATFIIIDITIIIIIIDKASEMKGTSHLGS
jgi:hypothetical protein